VIEGETRKNILLLRVTITKRIMVILRRLQSSCLVLFACLLHLDYFQEINAATAPRFLQRHALFRNVTRIVNEWKRRLRRDESDAFWNEPDETYDDSKVATIGSVLISSFQQPPSKFISRSLLWGIFFYGIMEVGKLIASSMEELQQQLNSASSATESFTTVNDKNWEERIQKILTLPKKTWRNRAFDRPVPWHNCSDLRVFPFNPRPRNAPSRPCCVD
jgi:hypothetical protein